MAKRKDLEYDRGGPAGGIKLMATYMYKLPFQQFNMGYCPCVAAGAVSPDYFNCAAVPEDLCGKGGLLKWLSKKRLLQEEKAEIPDCLGNCHFFAWAWLVVTLVPFIFMIMNSFRKQFDILAQGGHLPAP